MVNEWSRMSWQDYQPTPDVGPPIDVLPGYMNYLRVLAQTDDIAIAIGGFRVWEVGFLFTLSVRLSPEGMAKLNLYDVTFGVFGPEKPSVLLEMRWPNGRRVSNTKHQRPGARHTLNIRGGGGGGPFHDINWWVSPLPRPPAIILACTWPEANISETTAEVPAQDLREAASHQIRLWT